MGLTLESKGQAFNSVSTPHPLQPGSPPRKQELVREAHSEAGKDILATPGPSRVARVTAWKRVNSKLGTVRRGRGGSGN